MPRPSADTNILIASLLRDLASVQKSTQKADTTFGPYKIRPGTHNERAVSSR